jgi:hypothetical protein
MTEFVYQLKLPPIKDMLLDGVAEQILSPATNFKYKTVTADSIIKPECLEINGFKFNRALLFHKANGDLGIIHKDSANPKNTVWGINWVYSGFGTLEFWDESDLVNANSEAKIDEEGNYVRHYEANVPARKKYMMYAPCAYLVNATQIHRPVGWGSRWAISLRTGIVDISWEDLVEKFKDLIV